MPTILTVWIAKFIAAFLRATGKGGGGALPGLVAEKLDRKILAKLAKRLPEGSIIVTGTNGKTTTTKMLGEILTGQGRQLVTNKTGSNLSRGLISALIADSDWRGRPRAKRGLFEVDEAAVPGVCGAIKPKAIVVLNLFRDQLDRYGELDKTAGLIGQGIVQSPSAKVILNADDPLVASLAKFQSRPNQVTYFGIEQAPIDKLEHDYAADSQNCPVCGQPLVYTTNFYGHIGHYRCKDDHIRRPKPQVTITKFEQATADGSRFAIKTPTGKQTVELQLGGVYNAYNALAALAAAEVLGVDLAQSVPAVEAVTAAFGRVEEVEWQGRTLKILLIKNPTGFNQVIQSFLLADSRRHILVAINDNLADGRDVSWLWDVGFEALAPKNHWLVATGIRAADLALRLKYAGIEASVVENLESAVAGVVKATPEGQTAYILPTYTAMLQLRNQLGLDTKLREVKR